MQAYGFLPGGRVKLDYAPVAVDVDVADHHEASDLDYFAAAVSVIF